MLKRVLLCVTARSSVPRDRGTAQAGSAKVVVGAGRSLPSVTSKRGVDGAPHLPRRPVVPAGSPLASAGQPDGPGRLPTGRPARYSL